MALSHISHHDAHGVGQATLSVSPAAVGNLQILSTDQASSATGPDISSISGGGVTTWTKIMNVAGFSTVGKNEMWFGVTTTAGAATITITWSAANTLNTEIAVEEFSASDTGASWSVSTSNNFRSSNPGTTNCVFPSLVAAASGSLLGFGYASTGTAFTGIGTGASGDTYTYTVTGFSNGAVYAVNLTNGTTESPVGKQTSINQEILMHALMLYTPAAGGGAPKRALLGVGT